MEASLLAPLIPNPSSVISLLVDEFSKIYILKYCYLALVAEFDVPPRIKDDILQICGLPPNVKVTGKRALLLIKTLINLLTETINTGRYDEVDSRYQQLLVLATYLKIILTLKNSTSPKSLEICLKDMDYALLVGGPLDSTSDSLIALCKSNASKTSAIIPKIAKTIKRVSDIPILEQPSLQQFQVEHFAPQKPAQLIKCLEQWPANSKWRQINYLIEVAGNRTVPVEVGAQYVDKDWSQELVKFENFLERQMSDNTCNRVEYLAQHNLFDQIPALKEDIRTPEYCCLSNFDDNSSLVEIKAWLGPSGTISTMHQDPKHNLLCQVIGAKKIILAAPDEADNLYPYEGKMLQNTSQVDAENLDFERFPLARNVKFFSVTLLEGDVLYIPPKWWHYVRSLSRSMSVSFWWE